MQYHLLVTFVVLLGAAALFLSERLKPDLVALLVLLSLGVTGVLTPQEVFSGFGRSAVITIVAVFVLAEGLHRAGVTEQAGTLLLKLGGSGERRLLVVVAGLGALLSLFMNNIAAAAVLLPAVSGASRKAGVHPSRVLMPLAFGTLLGGMATLFTTTNIVVSSLLRDAGLPGFGVLDFAPVGLPLAAAGVAYLALWGPRLLAARPAAATPASPRQPSDLAEIYHLDERLFRARIPEGSLPVGKSLAHSSLRESFGLDVVAIERKGQALLSPPPDTVFHKDDILILEGKLEKFREQVAELGLEILPVRTWHEQDLESAAVIVAEAVLAPRSRLIGQTLREARFREKFGMRVIAVWRAGRPIRTALADLPLQFGDALLLHGPRERFPLLHTEPDIILLTPETVEAVPVPSRGWLALGILGVTLAIAALAPVPVAETMLAGALVMALAGILTTDQAYHAIEWRTVILVAGMLPLGIAMANTGAAALLAGWLVALVGHSGPLVLLAGLFILAMLLTQVMNGPAVATIMAPIAIEAARQLQVDPRALAMGVALATSMAFLTPLGHPVNLLVMGPGEYRFRDYAHVGLPLTLLLFALVMVLLPLVWPLHSP